MRNSGAVVGAGGSVSRQRDRESGDRQPAARQARGVLSYVLSTALAAEGGDPARKPGAGGLTRRVRARPAPRPYGANAGEADGGFLSLDAEPANGIGDVWRFHIGEAGCLNGRAGLQRRIRWQPADASLQARAAVEAAGLAYVEAPYIADAVRRLGIQR